MDYAQKHECGRASVIVGMDAPSLRRVVWQDSDVDDLALKPRKAVLVTIFVAENMDPDDAGSKDASSAEMMLPLDPDAAWYWDFLTYKAPPKIPKTYEERAEYAAALRNAILHDCGVSTLGNEGEQVLRDFVERGNNNKNTLRLKLPGRVMVAVVE